jgi:S-adenosylmethionine-dependent methyltransferase
MSSVIKEYYNKGVEIEWSRMDRHPLEFEITKRHIDQVIHPKSRILDIGGGPGKYSFHYAALGHKVTLIDLAESNIEYARNKQHELNIYLESLRVGDATSLKDIEDDSFDIIFCMGPLYHLIAESDRKKAVNECKRIVKKNGSIIFSFITIMAQTISVIKRYPLFIKNWERALSKGIEKGINDSEYDTGFTEAFFVDPLKVEDFLVDCGLLVTKLAGAEGIACQSEPDLLKLPRDVLDEWINFSFKYSECRSTLGANQHVLCIAKKT